MQIIIFEIVHKGTMRLSSSSVSSTTNSNSPSVGSLTNEAFLVAALLNHGRKVQTDQQSAMVAKRREIKAKFL